MTGLLLLIPVGLGIAVAIVLESGRPVFFTQVRIGRDGRPFSLWKFRSMVTSNAGAQITSSGDKRITRVGRIIRKYKLDELPQLWNVLRGDMNLIGPRPEVPRYVNLDDPAWKAVLSVRPGITDLATLVYRNEEEILASAADSEQCYREKVLPEKLNLNREYLRCRTFGTDLKLLGLTVLYSFAPGGFEAAEIKTRILSNRT